MLELGRLLGLELGRLLGLKRGRLLGLELGLEQDMVGTACSRRRRQVGLVPVVAPRHRLASLPRRPDRIATRLILSSTRAVSQACSWPHPLTLLLQALAAVELLPQAQRRLSHRCTPGTCHLELQLDTAGTYHHRRQALELRAIQRGTVLV